MADLCIILGMARSTTTAVHRLIASHPMVTPHTNGHQAYAMECDELRMPPREDRADLLDAAAASCPTPWMSAKRPWSEERWDWLLARWPDAAYVVMRRPLEATIDSWCHSPLTGKLGVKPRSEREQCYWRYVKHQNGLLQNANRCTLIETDRETTIEGVTDILANLLEIPQDGFDRSLYQPKEWTTSVCN